MAKKTAKKATKKAAKKSAKSASTKPAGKKVKGKKGKKKKTDNTALWSGPPVSQVTQPTTPLPAATELEPSKSPVPAAEPEAATATP